MLHEIQPGDVVIVTVAEPKASFAVGGLEHLSALLEKMGGKGSVFVSGTETSVHVLRAKRAEDKPKPDIVCTRCGTPATISNICMCGKPGCIGCIGCCKKRQSGEPDAKPKPERRGQLY